MVFNVGALLWILLTLIEAEEDKGAQWGAEGVQGHEHDQNKYPHLY